jgi:hypothetical protein
MAEAERKAETKNAKLALLDNSEGLEKTKRRVESLTYY